MDDLLKSVGEFGRFQKRVYAFLCLPSVLLAMHKLSWVFIGGTPPHRCMLPQESESALFNISTDTMYTWYPMNPSPQADVDFCRLRDNGTGEFVTCQRYVYDLHNTMKTATSEWDLVCGRKSLAATVQATLMLGELVGCVAAGALADRFGRRIALSLCLALTFIFGLVGGFSTTYLHFLIARFFLGFALPGVFSSAYIIGLELVGPSKRLFVGNVMNFFWPLGNALMVLIAYTMTNWRHIHLAITLSGIPFLAYWWIVPESVRWLLQNGRMDDAKRVIEKVAKKNKASISSVQIDHQLHLCLKEQEHRTSQENFLGRHGRVWHVLSCRHLRLAYPIIFFNWFICAGGYYSLSLNSSTLSGDKYVNFLLVSIVEIPAYALFFMADRTGRRSLLAGAYIVTAAAVLSSIFFPEEWTIGLVINNSVGKLAISVAYSVVILQSPEIFPTVIRTSSMGMSTLCSRFGAILAPYLLLLGDYWIHLPNTVLGVLVILGALISFSLPETLHQPLPETLDDAECLFRRWKQNDVELVPTENENSRRRSGKSPPPANETSPL